MFITLTDESARDRNRPSKIHLNVDMLCYYHLDSGRTRVVMGNGMTCFVKETPEEIAGMIEAGQ